MKNEFDLQLFADGEEMASDTGVTENTDTAAETATEPIQEEHAQEESKPDFMLRVDPQTGRREFLTGDEVQPKEEQQEKPQETVPNAYTADDLFRDFAMGRVDESRVPPELEGYYSSIKTQQENAQLRQQAAMQQMQVQQQPPAQPTTPVDNSAQMVAVYQQMEKYAKEKAFHDLGIDGDEALTELQYSEKPGDKQKYAVFGTAVQQNMQLINQAVAEQQHQAAAEQQATMNEANIIRNGVAEYMQNEPHFNEIDQMMGTYYRTMPFEKAGPIAESLNRVVQVFTGQPGAKLLPNDKDVLNEYYQECKKAFYAKQTGVPTTPKPAARPTPPNVEHTGQASNTPAEKVDWRAMRSMSPRDRRQFFLNNI